LTGRSNHCGAKIRGLDETVTGLARLGLLMIGFPLSRDGHHDCLLGENRLKG
jgi:hypothetical protein